MESLDNLRERESQKLGKEVLKPVEVRTVNDIKNVLREFDPSNNPKHQDVPLRTQVDVNDGGRTKTFAVSANTKSKSKRDHIIEGLNIIKNRIEKSAKYDDVRLVEINGREVRPPRVGDSINSHTWVDSIIKQWMGGKRDNTIIYWDLDDGYRYKYDIFNHKLTRVRNEPSSSTSGAL